MFNDHYALAFNPFDKQQVKECDRFESQDFKEMSSRLDYLKDTRGIGLGAVRDKDLILGETERTVFMVQDRLS